VRLKAIKKRVLQYFWYEVQIWNGPVTGGIFFFESWLFEERCCSMFETSRKATVTKRVFQWLIRCIFIHGRIAVEWPDEQRSSQLISWSLWWLQALTSRASSSSMANNSLMDAMLLRCPALFSFVSLYCINVISMTGMVLWRSYCKSIILLPRGIEIACRPSVCPSVCLWRWWIRIT